MKFINSGNIDAIKRRADKRNMKFGNFIISTTRMEGFTFSQISGISIQSADFYLQKLRYNSDTDTYEYFNYLLLDDTYKKTGYFEPYDFASEIDEGCYRIYAGGFYSATMVLAKKDANIVTLNYIYLASVNPFGAAVTYILTDNDGNYLATNKMK